MFLATFFILLLFTLCLFLGQIAVQCIRVERRLEDTVAVLEEELIDVFGSHSIEMQQQAEKAKKETAIPPTAALAAVASMASQSKGPAKAPAKPPAKAPKRK